MVDLMKKELHGVVLNLGEYELNTLQHVEEIKKDEIIRTIQKLREECVQALLMMNEIDSLDEEGKDALRRGVKMIKRKAVLIFYPVKKEENMAFYFGGRRADSL
jgi:hypothetical protein